MLIELLIKGEKFGAFVCEVKQVEYSRLYMYSFDMNGLLFCVTQHGLRQYDK